MDTRDQQVGEMSEAGQRVKSSSYNTNINKFLGCNIHRSDDTIPYCIILYF